MKTRFVMVMLGAMVLAACGNNPGVDEHSHGADEGGSWAVTAWGEHFELFPEIDVLVAGETAGAHVHVTILDGFRPATVGSVAVVLLGTGQVEERFTSTTAIRPGIFNVEIHPRTSGDRALRFEIEVEGVAETISGGRVRVGTEDEPGGLVEPPLTLPRIEGDEEVDFLKEQQWRTAFKTAWAERSSLRPSVTGTALVEPPSGGEAMLTAPVSGVVRSDSWPYTGQRVRAGEELMSLISTTGTARSLAELKASVRELEAQSEVAAIRAVRLEVLLERQAVSQREVEQARAEATGLAARLEAGRATLAAAEAGRMGREDVTGLEIRAPFVGRVAEVLVSPGEQIAPGASLVRMIRERPVWIRVALTPGDADLFGLGLSGLTLDAGANSAVLELSAQEVRPIAIAPEVDPRTGTVEALIEVERDVDQLKPGLRATVQILLQGEVEGMVLPHSAVVDDAGVPVVYVQLEGEGFARREVSVEQRQGALLLVEGILPGERVVTVGGAAIRRASLLASGSVAGHVH